MRRAATVTGLALFWGLVAGIFAMIQPVLDPWIFELFVALLGMYAVYVIYRWWSGARASSPMAEETSISQADRLHEAIVEDVEDVLERQRVSTPEEE